MKHLMPNDPRHEISRSTGGHFKRCHKRSRHRSRDVPLSLHCQHWQCSLHIRHMYLNETNNIPKHLFDQIILSERNSLIFCKPPVYAIYQQIIYYNVALEGLCVYMFRKTVKIINKIIGLLEKLNVIM
jgi:hypothetical protein